MEDHPLVNPHRQGIMDELPWDEMEDQMEDHLLVNPRRQLDSLSEDDPHPDRDGNLRHRRRRAKGLADPAAAAIASAGSETRDMEAGRANGRADPAAAAGKTRDMEAGREEMEEEAAALLCRHPSVNSHRRRRLDSLSEDDPHPDDEIRPLPGRANGEADPAAAATGSETNLIRGTTVPRLTAEYRCPFCHLSFTPLPPVGGGYLSCTHYDREFVHDLEAERPSVNRRRQLDSLSEDTSGGIAREVSILTYVSAVAGGAIMLYEFQKAPTKAVQYGCYGLVAVAVLTIVLLIGGFCFRSAKVIWAGRASVVILTMIFLALIFISLAEKQAK